MARLVARRRGPEPVEEIDIVTRGGNYGWSEREGAHCSAGVSGDCQTAGLIDPVAEYTDPTGESVVGYVYRGVTGAGRRMVFAIRLGMVAHLTPAACATPRNWCRRWHPAAPPARSAFHRLAGANGDLYASTTSPARSASWSGIGRRRRRDNVPTLLSQTGCINTCRLAHRRCCH